MELLGRLGLQTTPFLAAETRLHWKSARLLRVRGVRGRNSVIVVLSPSRIGTCWSLRAVPLALSVGRFSFAFLLLVNGEEHPANGHHACADAAGYAKIRLRRVHALFCRFAGHTLVDQVVDLTAAVDFLGNLKRYSRAAESQSGAR